jgi:hypothetical protein
MDSKQANAFKHIVKYFFLSELLKRETFNFLLKNLSYRMQRFHYNKPVCSVHYNKPACSFHLHSCPQ